MAGMQRARGHFRRLGLGALGALMIMLGGCKFLGGGSSTTPNGTLSHTPGTFSSFTIATKNGGPEAIAVGPNDNLWFTETTAAKIGTITTQGTLGPEYSFPETTAAAYSLVLGPGNKALWFTNYGLGKVGYLTANGKFTEFALSSPYARPIGMVVGPDGALWFSENAATTSSGQSIPAIGRITPDGKLTDFPIPNPAGSTAAGPVSIPQMLTVGPDGNIWFTDAGANAIGSITSAGTFTFYTIPTSNSHPFTIVKGTSDDLWFTEANAIGHLPLTEGKVHEFATPTVGVGVRGLVLGRDGALWFTEYTANALGRMTQDGTFTTYPLPSNGQKPDQLVLGPDGLLWFTAPGANSIDAFSLP